VRGSAKYPSRGGLAQYPTRSPALGMVGEGDDCDSVTARAAGGQTARSVPVPIKKSEAGGDDR